MRRLRSRSTSRSQASGCTPARPSMARPSSLRRRSCTGRRSTTRVRRRSTTGSTGNTGTNTGSTGTSTTGITNTATTAIGTDGLRGPCVESPAAYGTGMDAFTTVTQFARMLENLDRWLAAGVSYAESKKFDPDVLARSRLAPDQYELV